MKILLYPNRVRDAGLSYTRKAAEILRGAGAELCIRPEPEDRLPEWISRKTEEYDMVLALGGDGTMLAAAQTALARDVPLAGVNVGTLGYLSSLERGEMELLAQLLRPDLRVERRMLISWKTLREGRVLAAGDALNDVTLKNAAVSTVLDLSVERNGQRMYAFRGDGVIAATPTGSTAYTFSAGGPLMEPEAEAVIITPICAHSLAARSVVLSAAGETALILRGAVGGEGFLAADGRECGRLAPGDRVVCTRSGRTLKLANLRQTPFFDIVARKLSGEAGGENL